MPDIKSLTFAQATLTDAGTVNQPVAQDFVGEFEGTLLFAVTSNEVTGTLDGDVQLQGSLDNSNWVNIGSTVALVDGSTIGVPLGGVILYYNYYRAQTVGVGTQSSTLDTVFTAKVKN